MSDIVQRWNHKKSRFKPAHETINPAEFEVALIDSDKVARSFIETHHYSKSYPSARWRFGLYRKNALVGVAVYSHPMSEKTLTNVFPGKACESVELGRLVLLDEVKGNGESWFLARTFETLRQEVRGVVSFSDPIPRQNEQGEEIFPGHVGVIYQALNGIFLGRGTARTLRLLPDGTVFSDRAAPKIRAMTKGWRYCADLLEAAGAAPLQAALDAGQTSAEWVAYWAPRCTRPMRHPGNFKYAWSFSKSEDVCRMALPLFKLPYPKKAKVA